MPLGGVQEAKPGGHIGGIRGRGREQGPSRSLHPSLVSWSHGQGATVVPSLMWWYGNRGHQVPANTLQPLPTFGATLEVG